MELRESVEGRIVLFKLRGTLRAEEDSGQLREKVYSYAKTDHLNFVFDIADLTYVNSWGLGLLVALLSMLRKRGGDLRLARVGGHIHDLFIVTQLSNVFQTYESVASALKSYENAG